MRRFLGTILRDLFVVALLAMAQAGYAQPAADVPDADEPSAQGQPQKSTMLDTLEIKNMDINDVLKLLADKSGLNIIAGKSITGRVTIFLQNVDVRDALTIILKANDLAYMEGHGVLQIMTGAEYEQTTGHKFGVSTQSTIVSLHSAKASDMVAILNQVKSQGGKVVADDQSNSVIIEDVPEKMDQLLAYVKTIDAPTQMEVYKLQHIAGDPLVAKLQEMVSTKIGSVKFDPFSNKLFIEDTPRKLKEIMKYVSQVDVPRETRVFHVNYAKADELAKTIGPMLTKDVGSIEYDARSNTLVAMDISPKMDEIQVMITALDKHDKEVFIEAKIVQIALGDNYQMGINWEALIPNANHTVVNLQSNFSLPGPITTGLGTATIGTLNRDNYNVVLQALDTFGKSRTLSNPHLAVINNQEASILIGTTIPYTTSTVTTPASGPTTSAESVNFIDTGVKLHVTPTIHDDGYITMKIKPEISNEESAPFTAPDGSLIPIVDTSEVQTTVSVKDGVTIIIGGLIKDQLINNKTKIPVLGDLPILGKAFNTENRNMQKTEIVIFLTPYIINGDARSDPREYLKKTSTLKSERIYYDPLPRDKSTVPVP
jgi:type II secretory pathway component GspD/PulD (secretin)